MDGQTQGLDIFGAGWEESSQGSGGANGAGDILKPLHWGLRASNRPIAYLANNNKDDNNNNSNNTCRVGALRVCQALYGEYFSYVSRLNPYHNQSEYFNHQ